MLPTDLAIFSPSSRTMPLCIQMRASGFPRAASVWAISFSWCGKTRSEPPPWISKSTPRISSAIAEHSMCQPGRPAPQGASSAVSSPSFCAFQSAKSCGLSFSVGGVVALALLHLLERAVRELAVAVEARHAEVDVAARRVGVARVDQRLDQRRRSRRSSRSPSARGPAGRGPSRVRVVHVGGGHLARQLLAGHAGLARGVVDLVVHVGDVLDQRHVVALVLEEALQQREDDERAGVADVDAARRPSGRRRRCRPCPGSRGSSASGRR